jgi:hypothetical protein
MGTKKKRKSAVKIERHLPSVGTLLVATYNGKRYEAVVVESSEFPERKGIEYGQVVYRSMTAAANAITHTSVNGWLFWRIA